MAKRRMIGEAIYMTRVRIKLIGVNHQFINKTSFKIKDIDILPYSRKVFNRHATYFAFGVVGDGACDVRHLSDKDLQKQKKNNIMEVRKYS